MHGSRPGAQLWGRACEGRVRAELARDRIGAPILVPGGGAGLTGVQARLTPATVAF